MIVVAIVSGLGAGKSIREQDCEYLKTERGQPAIRVKWSGLFFSAGESVFVFAEHADSITRLSPDEMRKAIQSGQFRKAQHRSGGALLGMIAGAVASSGTPSAEELSGLGHVGITVQYQDTKGKVGFFAMVGSAAVVEEIVSSVSPERIIKGS